MSRALSSLWDYDLDPVNKEMTPKTTKPCSSCAKKQAELEETRAVHADLVQSFADLTREKAECFRELEALKAKLRSLEHGGGVPHPAPPNPGAHGSGGGVASRPANPSPSAPPLLLSLPSSGGGLHGEQNSGPAAAAPPRARGEASSQMAAVTAGAKETPAGTAAEAAAREARARGAAEAAATATATAMGVGTSAATSTSRRLTLHAEAAASAPAAPAPAAAGSIGANRGISGSESNGVVAPGDAEQQQQQLLQQRQGSNRGGGIGSGGGGGRDSSSRGGAVRGTNREKTPSLAACLAMGVDTGLAKRRTKLSPIVRVEDVGAGEPSCPKGLLKAAEVAQTVSWATLASKFSKAIALVPQVESQASPRPVASAAGIAAQRQRQQQQQQQQRRRRQQGTVAAQRRRPRPPPPRPPPPPPPPLAAEVPFSSSVSSHTPSAASVASCQGLPSSLFSRQPSLTTGTRSAPRTSSASSSLPSSSPPPIPQPLSFSLHSSPPENKSNSNGANPNNASSNGAKANVNIAGGRALSLAAAYARASGGGAFGSGGGGGGGGGRQALVMPTGAAVPPSPVETGTTACLGREESARGTAVAATGWEKSSGSSAAAEGGGRGSPGGGRAVTSAPDSVALSVSPRASSFLPPASGSDGATGRGAGRSGSGGGGGGGDGPVGSSAPDLAALSVSLDASSSVPPANASGSGVAGGGQGDGNGGNGGSMVTSAPSLGASLVSPDAPCPNSSAAIGSRNGDVDGSAGGSCGGGDRDRPMVPSAPVSTVFTMSPGASSSVPLASSPVGGKQVRPGGESGGGGGSGGGDGDGDVTTAPRREGETTCKARHMHVLQCFLCGQYPMQPKDGRTVIFCSKCPRKACLSCQLDRVSKDRTGWVKGRDMFGRFYEIPECRECQKGSDNEVPVWVQPPWMESQEGEISEGDTRLLLDKFLSWLKDHELAHFFVDEVDPKEYPDYQQMVKNPMNLTRMRKRLEAGYYDSRRAGLNLFMEDVDWIRHNCFKYNGELAAISRSSLLLLRRAEKYHETHIAPMVNILRRPGSEGAHRAPAFSSKKRTGAAGAGAVNGGSSGSRSGSAEGGGGGGGGDGKAGGGGGGCGNGAVKRKRQGSPRTPSGGDASSRACPWVKKGTTPPPLPPTSMTPPPPESPSTGLSGCAGQGGGDAGEGGGIGRVAVGAGGVRGVGEGLKTENGVGGGGGAEWFGPRSTVGGAAAATAAAATAPAPVATAAKAAAAVASPVPKRAVC